jgi:hypothetical protein
MLVIDGNNEDDKQTEDKFREVNDRNRQTEDKFREVNDRKQ